MKFQVLRGVHSHGGQIYRKGDVVESDVDLTKHNTPGSPRFAPIGDGGVAVVDEPVGSDDGLDEMNVRELREYAEEGGIDLSGTKSKDAIIERIREGEAED